MVSVRRIRCLNIVDDFTKQCLATEVDHSLPGRRGVHVLERLAEKCGLPASIRVDNSPKFASKALDAWACECGFKLYLIEPGKQQNAYMECFDGKFRDKYLNEHWFVSLRYAREAIEEWRRDYIEQRPHGTIGYLTLNQFAYSFKSRTLVWFRTNFFWGRQVTSKKTNEI
ncbi:integrase core domain-containing protein [Undibacterium luofuense]|uniref:Transposase family protein n=1 Tax=Undibacterium luofuense TaxID=2828733 RepID=A0A941I6R0_9BURK|nr:integrase core domain-containing protein [Undibacterium luofuense]MBR7781855.1 transposase family protein [Undibacterium luofuense]